jgi:hypothetical protein
MQVNANESCRGCTEAIHPFAGLANTGSALNICVYLRLTAFSRLNPGYHARPGPQVRDGELRRGKIAAPRVLRPPWMAEVRKVQEQSFRRSRGIHSFPGNKKPATPVFTF